MRYPLLFLGLALLAGCGASTAPGTPVARPVSINALAKSDIDDFSELTQQSTLDSLRRLTDKLYRRNPQYWRQAGHASADAASAAVFAAVPHWGLSPLKNSDWQRVLQHAYDPAWQGDRVGELMRGLLVMTLAAYNHETAFYLTDRLDPQKLYDSARNFEIAAWKLARARDGQGQPLLLSNHLVDGDVPNLSFEREFGKLIANQDLLARLLAEKDRRRLRTTLHGVASMVFIPI
jgi:hypothetical protein